MNRESHIISVLAQDHPGVMNRITSLLRRRQFNIHSLTAGPSEIPGLSRLTITVDAGSNLEQVVRQLDKLIEVVRVRALEQANTLIRETAVVQCKKSTATTKKIHALVKKHDHARIIDESDTLVTLRISGTPENIDTLAATLQPLGLFRIARTGIAALPRD